MRPMAPRTAPERCGGERMSDTVVQIIAGCLLLAVGWLVWVSVRDRPDEPGWGGPAYWHPGSKEHRLLVAAAPAVLDALLDLLDDRFGGGAAPGPEQASQIERLGGHVFLRDVNLMVVDKGGQQRSRLRSTGVQRNDASPPIHHGLTAEPRDTPVSLPRRYPSHPTPRAVWCRRAAACPRSS